MDLLFMALGAALGSALGVAIVLASEIVDGYNFDADWFASLWVFVLSVQNALCCILIYNTRGGNK